MQAKPTIYNGYQFRSKLEAKWAVFFDACKIRYEYEPEAFECADGGQYTPDFYLPDVWACDQNKGVFVEIKPNATIEYNYIIRVASAIKSGSLAMVFGDPYDAIPDFDNRNCLLNYKIGLSAGLWHCRSCDGYKFEHGYKHKACPECGKETKHAFLFDHIQAASELARQYRFEYFATTKINIEADDNAVPF